MRSTQSTLFRLPSSYICTKYGLSRKNPALTISKTPKHTLDDGRATLGPGAYHSTIKWHCSGTPKFTQSTR